MNENKPSMEYPFHLEVYNKFPQVSVMIHIHSPAFVALSLLAKENPKLIEVSRKFKLGYAEYAMPGSDLLGSNICETIQKGYVSIIMQNHGFLAVGKNISKVLDHIRELYHSIVAYLNIKHLYEEFSIRGRFELNKQENISFYKKRIRHYLSIAKDSKIIYHQENGFIYAAVQLSSLTRIPRSEFSTHIIPESYLLLKNPLIINDQFCINDFKGYQKLFKQEEEVILFNEGWSVFKAKSLYEMYDKMEVLDFTAKVISLAREAGEVELLSNEQIIELEGRFFKQ